MINKIFAGLRYEGVSKTGRTLRFAGKFLCLIVLIVIASSTASIGQFIVSTTGDQEAENHTTAQGARNTGTDVLKWNEDGSHGIQVMVWDGEQPQLSWDCDFSGTGCKGSIDLLQYGYTTYCDPDVVVGSHLQAGNAIYALVVGIAKRNDLDYILATVFVYTGGGFSFDKKCWMGQAKAPETFNPDNFASKGRKCYSPNVDANSLGQVAITWAEREENAVRVTIHYPNPPLTIGDVDYVTTIAKGNVFGLEGYIDGLDLDWDPCFKTKCTTYNYDPNHPSDIHIGYPVAQQGEIEASGERNLYTYEAPDVAISEMVTNALDQRRTAISYTYIRKSSLGQYSPSLPTGLLVYQKLFGAYCPTFERGREVPGTDIILRQDEDWLRNSLSGPPRIAAPWRVHESHLYDYTVVQANGGRGCDGSGYYWQSEVYAWTKRNNVLYDEPGSLILNTDLHNRFNILPVVTHISQEFWEKVKATELPQNKDGRDHFIVEWQSLNPVENQGFEILARLYSSVDPASEPDPIARYIPLTENYSVVNNRMVGEQVSPSIAGRNMGTYIAYDWINLNIPGDMYKRSTGIPSVDPLDNTCGTCSSGNFRVAVDPGQPVSVTPNPSDASFEIGVTVGEKEVVETIVITDLEGRVVATLKGDEATTKYNWKPDGKLPTGVYQARIQTNQKVYNKRLIRN